MDPLFYLPQNGETVYATLRSILHFATGNAVYLNFLNNLLPIMSSYLIYTSCVGLERESESSERPGTVVSKRVVPYTFTTSKGLPELKSPPNNRSELTGNPNFEEQPKALYASALIVGIAFKPSLALGSCLASRFTETACKSSIAQGSCLISLIQSCERSFYF